MLQKTFSSIQLLSLQTTYEMGWKFFQIQLILCLHVHKIFSWMIDFHYSYNLEQTIFVKGLYYRPHGFKGEAYLWSNLLQLSAKSITLCANHHQYTQNTLYLSTLANNILKCDKNRIKTEFISLYCLLCFLLFFSSIIYWGCLSQMMNSINYTPYLYITLKSHSRLT